MEPEATAREKYSAAGGFDMGSFEAFGFFPVIVETLPTTQLQQILGRAMQRLKGI